MEINPINNNQNTNPSFGVRYTKSTIKRLKELTPEFIFQIKSESDYKFLKAGFEHLVNAGKRVDGYIVRLVDEKDIPGIGTIETAVKRETGKPKHFYYPAYKDERTCCNDNVFSRLYKQYKFIDSDDFIPQTEEALNKHQEAREASKWDTFKVDMSVFMENIMDKIKEVFDFFLSSTYDVETKKNLWTPISFLQDLITYKKEPIEYTSLQLKRIDEIRQIIDKMRTEPINIELKSRKIEETPLMIEGKKQKLLK